MLPLHHISICAKRRTRTPDNQVWNLTFFQLNYLRFIAPGDRIELPTFTLTVYCSTNWANGQYTYTHLTCDTPFQRTCGNWTTPYRFCGKRWNRITLTGFSVRRIHHVCHLSIFSLYPHTPHRREKQCGNSNYCCGDSTRTNDLWAMIPTSYQLLHSAILSWKLLCTHNIHIYVVLASTTLHSQYNNTIDIAYIS